MADGAPENRTNNACSGTRKLRVCECARACVIDEKRRNDVDDNLWAVMAVFVAFGPAFETFRIEEVDTREKANKQEEIANNRRRRGSQK